MFQQHQSVEGAYHEAMEAAAQRIQLASRSSETITVNHRQRSSSSSGSSSSNSSIDDSGEITARINSSRSGGCSTTATSSSSGYSSDVDGSSAGVDDSEYSNEKSMMKTNDDIADTNKKDDDEDPTSSVSSVSGSSKDDVSYSSSSGSDMDDDMDFLRQKQDILKRASQAMQREDAYMALKARAIVNGEEMTRGSSLWSEAKSILEVLRNERNLEKNKVVSPDPSTATSIGDGNVLDEEMHEGNRQSLGQSTTSTDLESHEYEFQVPTKRLKIDLSTVSKVSANKFPQPGNTASSGTAATLPQAPSFFLNQELATSLFRAIG